MNPNLTDLAGRGKEKYVYNVIWGLGAQLAFCELPILHVQTTVTDNGSPVTAEDLGSEYVAI